MAGYRHTRKRRAFWFFLGLLFLITIWFVYLHYSEEDHAPIHVAEEGSEYLDLDQQASIQTEAPEPIKKTLSVNRGESFLGMMQENGIAQTQAFDILAATKGVFDLSKVLPGHEMVLLFSSDGLNLIGLDYEISDQYRLRIAINEDSIDAQKVAVQHILADTYSGDLKLIDVDVKKGDSIYSILHECDLSDYQIDCITRSVKNVYNLSGIVPGNNLKLWVTEDAPVLLGRLTYEIDDLSLLEVEPENGTFAARKQTLSVETRYERAEGTIESSLYQSGIAAGISPEVIMELTDVFAWDINFFTEIRAGDTFAGVYETYYVEDKFKGYGRVVAARFVNQGQEHLAIYFDKGNGESGYYDANGKPIQKLFLKAPLNYRRISSGFSNNRMHPVYQVARPHLGVDYAAPTGTPVVALGDGKIIFKGWSNGFGKSIRIKHCAGYISYYGHFSRYAKGMESGKQVSQGQVIGYVGSTGVATGPHLDFRVKHNGKFVNPLRLKPVAGPALSGAALAKFKEISARRLAMLDDPSLNLAMKSSNTE